MLRKFYVTTPIYYASAAPTIGSAYTTLAADILTRFYKLLGKKVFFLTGTDEHGKKLQLAAKQAGLKPKEFVDKIAESYKRAWSKLNVEYSGFIRTTDPQHEEAVKKLLLQLFINKFVYKGSYEGLYCVQCEQYLAESDLVDGKCSLHGIEPERRKEEAYLFKLSEFTQQLKKLIESDKLKIRPEPKKKEVLAFLSQGLRDIPISRKKAEVSWGIELPFDPGHTCYVWVDAFWNYLSGIGWPSHQFKKWWPPELQLMSKDIIRVHATIWPALLLAMKLKLPKLLFVHGFLTINGQKISKSLGNVIDPVYLAEKYGIDSLRYYLFRSIPFGQDGDVSEEALRARHNNELANKLGNLVSRVTALAEQHLIKKTKNKLLNKLKLKEINQSMLNLEFDKALTDLFAFIDTCNAYIQEQRLWETKKTKALYELCDSIRVISILLWPFMPQTAEQIASLFGFEIKSIQQCKPSQLKEVKISKAPILFKKIEAKEEGVLVKEKGIETEKGERKEVLLKEIEAKEKSKKGGEKKLSFSEWQKIDLRVGKILDVKPHPAAEKLYLLEINLGTEQRTLVAGLKQYYKPEQLKGKLCIVLANLEPATIRGIRSEGMALAAVSKDKSKIVLIKPKIETELGLRVKLQE